MSLLQNDVDHNNTKLMAQAMGKEVPPKNTSVTTNEKGATVLATTGKSCLDFFFKVSQNSTDDLVLELLHRAWLENPLYALKIIGYIRSCAKGLPGQGARNAARVGYKWLMDKHPETFKTNFPIFIKLGYWGDMKHFIHQNQLWHFIAIKWAEEIVNIHFIINAWLDKYNVTMNQYCNSPFHDMVPLDDNAKFAAEQYKHQIKSKTKGLTPETCAQTGTWVKLYPLPQIDNFGAIKYIPPSQSGKNKPKNKESINNIVRATLRRAISSLVRYVKQSDKFFTLDFFGQITGAKNRIITDEMFRRYFVRPATKRLKLTEEMVCAQRFTEIDYSTIPSRANKRHAKSFKTHDADRYDQYLSDVMVNKTTINSSRLAPHEIIDQALSGQETGKEIDALWHGLNTYLDKEGVYLDGWMPIIDQSGSMFSSYNRKENGVVPGHAALALGLLVAQRNRTAFNNFFITFASQPKMQLVQGETITEKIKYIRRHNKLTTNFVAVAKEIVRNYKELDIKQEDALKQLVVLTDMEHDKPHHLEEPLDRSHEAFINTFTQANYPVPKIVYWNMDGRNIHFPVSHDSENVFLISGYSADLLYLMMQVDGNPYNMMQHAIDNPILNQMEVVD